MSTAMRSSAPAPAPIITPNDSDSDDDGATPSDSTHKAPSLAATYTLTADVVLSCEHTVHCAAPPAATLPGAHAAQALAPLVAANWATPHGEQAAVPGALEKAPGAHATHTLGDEAPTTLLAVPAAHDAQTVALVADHEPTTHSCFEAGEVQYEPALHGTCAVLEAGQ